MDFSSDYVSDIVFSMLLECDSQDFFVDFTPPLLSPELPADAADDAQWLTENIAWPNTASFVSHNDAILQQPEHRRRPFIGGTVLTSSEASIRETVPISDVFSTQNFWSSDQDPLAAAVELLSGDTTTTVATSAAPLTSYVLDDVTSDEYMSLGFLNDVGDGGIVVNGGDEEDDRNRSLSTISPSTAKKLSTISSEEPSMTTTRRRDEVKSAAKQRCPPIGSTKNVELERLSSSPEDCAAAQKRAYSCGTSSHSDADETSMAKAPTGPARGRRHLVNIREL